MLTAQRSWMSAEWGSVPAATWLGGSPFRSRLLHKPERHAVHAVTQPRRFRSVIENVSKMCVASRTLDFCANHSQTAIARFVYVFLLDGRRKTRPAGAGIKLLGRTKQRQLTSGAFKSAGLMNVIQRARERSFSSLLAHHVVLLRRQLALPLGIGLSHFFDSFGFRGCSLSLWERVGVRAYARADTIQSYVVASWSIRISLALRRGKRQSRQRRKRPERNCR